MADNLWRRAAGTPGVVRAGPSPSAQKNCQYVSAADADTGLPILRVLPDLARPVIFMREGQFIRRNKDRWQEYEQPTDDPDELARRFTNLVDDLAYARTFYPLGNTVRYLNGLAANIYRSIYSARREKGSRLISFWTEELPLIFFRHRRTLLAAFLFFMAFVLIGIFSSMQDQTLLRAVLGDRYMDMTERNIASGNPFGVYKQQSPMLMFIYIAMNNIGVSFNCFILGITCSVGTLYYLFQNALMLGAFEHFFFRHGLGMQSILVVFIHGTLEISAIVVSGMAGMVLGNSILFPKTFTRRQSILRGVKEGVKIMVGLIPVYVVAAFFEGFVTRHTEMPLWMSMSILGGSLAFVIFYYIVYPLRVGRGLQQHG
jgi:uncharacterized membrane protein SpoIIM required for sporulation